MYLVLLLLFFSIFLWTINPFSDRAISLDRTRETNFKSIDLTNFGNFMGNSWIFIF